MSITYCIIQDKELIRPDGEVIISGYVADHYNWGNNELKILMDMLNRAFDQGRKNTQKHIQQALGD